VALGGTHLHVLISTKTGSSISVIEPSRFQKAPVDLWGEGVGGEGVGGEGVGGEGVGGEHGMISEPVPN
jgi:hypothetical protein